MTDDHPAVARFREAHRHAHGRGEVRLLPGSARTAALAAEALGCEVGAIANSLLFDAEGSPVLVLTSGAHRVDTAHVATVVGVVAAVVGISRATGPSRPSRDKRSWTTASRCITASSCSRLQAQTVASS